MNSGTLHTIWHGTTAGSEGKTLASISRQGGLLPVFSDSPGQKPGVYFSQYKDLSEGHVRGAIDHRELEGKPLLIETTLDTAALDHWDFDYELEFETVCNFLESFGRSLEDHLPLPSTRAKGPFNSFSNIDEVLAAARKRQEYERPARTYEDIPGRFFNIVSLKFDPQSVEIGIAGFDGEMPMKIASKRSHINHPVNARMLLETVCGSLSARCPELYAEAFRHAIEKKANAGKIRAIKYIGATPLPVHSVLELDC